ncbi:MAG TPA: DUF3108 domain-containing protein [Noviherbaspirillum sp.]|nr:DUF3108 domain-containing protein [Noviherbaspirillum sp.]
MSHTIGALTLAALVALPAGAISAPPNAVKYRTSPPPSAELAYSIKARQRGLVLEGSAMVRWKNAGRQFSVINETRSKLIGKILDTRSDGMIDEFGLAPLNFNEKRFSKKPTATTFDRKQGTISFSSSEAVYPLTGGEQDRNSIVWQLVSVARAAPTQFKPGSEWTFFVAGQRDAESWTFKVVKPERLSTPLGDLQTVQVRRLPPDGKGQQIDLWLAPQRDWYPVRLRFVDENGDYLEQTLERIARAS